MIQSTKQKKFNAISKVSLFCIPVLIPLIEKSPRMNHAKMYLILFISFQFQLQYEKLKKVLLFLL